MTLSIETIIYIYLFVSVSLIVFNIGSVIARKIEEKASLKRTKKYEILIERHLEEQSKDECHQKYFQKKLVHIRNLTSFHEAIQKVMEQEEKKAYAYLKRYEEIFLYLVQIYMKKEDIYKAYFAYLMSKYKICDAKEKNYITENILEFTKSSSLYVRENAMKALIAFGNIQNIIKALKNIKIFEYDYNKKVLTDDLLEFHGEIEKLIQELLKNFEDFTLEMQVGIINYISFKSEHAKEFFYKKLVEEENPKEIKLAIIRYFAHYPYEPVKKILYQYVETEDTNYWEYGAVSAFALKEYKSAKTKEILIHALMHPNWYIRKNAAGSLVTMKLTKEDIKKLKDQKDKYANEIFTYELKKKQKEMEKC